MEITDLGGWIIAALVFGAFVGGAAVGYFAAVWIDVGREKRDERRRED